MKFDELELEMAVCLPSGRAAAWVSHKHGNNNPLLRPMCYHFSELALA